MCWKLAVCALVLSACASSPPIARPSPTPPRELHVQFQSRTVDAFPSVGDVLVVDGSAGPGSVEIAGSGIRRHGEGWSFDVIGVGVSRIRLLSAAGEMDIYVRAVPRA